MKECSTVLCHTTYIVYNPLGANPQASEEAFCHYLFNLLLVQTPLDEGVNGIQIDEVGGNKQFATTCLHKLLADEYDRAKAVLVHTFSQLNPPANSSAEWSLNAEAAGYRVGVFYSLQGGQAGRGQLRIEPINFPRGIFRMP